MCIILTCNKGVRPDNDLIETCFWNNPDGAGIMWVEDGRVQTSKGFMDEQSLERAIAAVPLDSPLVIHMRIATSGGVSAATCHPFPVCDNVDVLHATDVECHAAVAHNGVILGVPTDKDRGISDTVYFVSHAINDMWRNDNVVTRKMRKKIAKKAPHNRFAILTEDGTIYRIGDGWESVTSGIHASNDSWRYDKWLYKGYSYSPSYYDWESYDWEGWRAKCGTYSSPKYDWESFDYDPEYAEYLDLLCGNCPDKARCRVEGALCEEKEEYIEQMLYGIDDGYYTYKKKQQ